MVIFVVRGAGGARDAAREAARHGPPAPDAQAPRPLDALEIERSSPEIERSSPGIERPSPEIERLSPEIERPSLRVIHFPTRPLREGHAPALLMDAVCAFLSHQSLERYLTGIKEGNRHRCYVCV